MIFYWAMVKTFHQCLNDSHLEKGAILTKKMEQIFAKRNLVSTETDLLIRAYGHTPSSGLC